MPLSTAEFQKLAVTKINQSSINDPFYDPCLSFKNHGDLLLELLVVRKRLVARRLFFELFLGLCASRRQELPSACFCGFDLLRSYLRPLSLLKNDDALFFMLVGLITLGGRLLFELTCFCLGFVASKLFHNLSSIGLLLLSSVGFLLLSSVGLPLLWDLLFSFRLLLL